MSHRRLSLLAAGLASAALLTAGVWLFTARPPGTPGGPVDLAAAPAKPGPDPFGYSAAFDAEVKKLGQITPGQFAAAYPPPAYLAKLSWDPTTAKFFDKINAETVVKEHKDLQGLRRFMLGTRDAHGLYKQFEFSELANPSRMMEILNPDVYRQAT